MGVPLLLTWLRNNFGRCITYVAPRRVGWGRRGGFPSKSGSGHAITDKGTAVHKAVTSSSTAGGAQGDSVFNDRMENDQPPPGAKPRVHIENARRTNKAHTFDNVYIDLNSLLYQSVTMVVERGLRDAESNMERKDALNRAHGGGDTNHITSSIGYDVETKILVQLVQLLDELLMMTNPTTLVYIAVDGISPKGKMSQQRNRRLATVKRGMHKKVKQLLGWDSNCITSGTLFMQRVTQVLHYYAVSRVERANNQVSVFSSNSSNSANDKLKELFSGMGAAASATTSSADGICIAGAGGGGDGSKGGECHDHASLVGISTEYSQMAYLFYERTAGMNNYNAAYAGSNSSSASDAKTGCVLAPGVSVIINDVRIAGEGEHKIIDAIRSFRNVYEGLDTSTPLAKAFTSEGINLRYHSNTSHCIVSPDTDVVVCSLSLHEPHITVFWYTAQDPDDSQFFSILLFRQMLKKRLGFGNSNDGDLFCDSIVFYGKSAPTKDAIFFEESLHDILFLLLLFGNDFLPKVSAFTDIADGQLDRLLKFYETDFVSRRKHIVDARTGRIDFEVARYVVEYAVNDTSNTDLVVNTVAKNGPQRHFDPFSQSNDVVSGATRPIGEMTEDERAAMCYDYWGGLQWAMLYCAGKCPSWSWHYPHTTVPCAQDLMRHCGMSDKLFQDRHYESSDGSGTFVMRAGVPMDVLTQLVLLMPMESRQLLPSSLSEAYVRDVAPLMTDKSFEEIDLRLVMNWCADMRKKLSTSDAQRMASFSSSRNPVMVRWPCDIARLAKKLDGVVPHEITADSLHVDEGLGQVGFVSETPDLDDLFDIPVEETPATDVVAVAPSVTATATRGGDASAWICVAGQVHVQDNTSPVEPFATGSSAFMLSFKENTDVPGMNTVTNTYRCADAACSISVELRPDWARGRPAIMVGECAETVADDEEFGMFACIPPTQPLLLPGTLELPQWPLNLLEGPQASLKRERVETATTEQKSAALEARRLRLKAVMEEQRMLNSNTTATPTQQ